MKVAVYKPCLVYWNQYYSQAAEPDKQNGYQLASMLEGLDRHVQLACVQGAHVFIAPEFYFSQNLHRKDEAMKEKKGEVGVKFTLDQSGYDEVRCNLLSFSRRYSDMTIVAGTVLWEDGTDARNTCLIVQRGQILAYHKKHIDNERNLMRSPFDLRRNPVSGGEGGCEVKTSLATNSGLKLYVQICRDAHNEPIPLGTALSLIPAFALGPFLFKTDAVACDGAGVSYVCSQRRVTTRHEEFFTTSV